MRTHARFIQSFDPVTSALLCGGGDAVKASTPLCAASRVLRRNKPDLVLSTAIFVGTDTCPKRVSLYICRLVSYIIRALEVCGLCYLLSSPSYHLPAGRVCSDISNLRLVYIADHMRHLSLDVSVAPTTVEPHWAFRCHNPVAEAGCLNRAATGYCVVAAARIGGDRSPWAHKHPTATARKLTRRAWQRAPAFPCALPRHPHLPGANLPGCAARVLSVHRDLFASDVVRTSSRRPSVRLCGRDNLCH